jgi:POT family proton-dependent oligopeptide transporter
MPAGMPYILTNEASERFAFYGMTSILVIFMTRYLVSREGTLAVMGDEEAKTWFHLFNSAVYFLPFVGALISDIWLAKYRTVIYFSLVYCVGFAALSLDHTRLGLGVGLVLMAVGSGVIKPCVSANVGDQFGKTNQHLLSKFYGWFYFSINLGACISMFICPWLLDWYGPLIGFGLPAGLMIVATVAYRLGRRKFVHIPAAGPDFVKETFSGEGLKAVGRLAILYLFIAMFWSLFYQSQSAWVLQAESMNLKWLGFSWLPEQPQAINPFLIMVMIPLFSYVVYPVLNRVLPLTALRKIIIGLFVVAVSFIVSAWIEAQINGGEIFKCSSRSTLARLEPFRLLDGLTDGTGWSSGEAPVANAPVELVVRLRERRSWKVTGIEIDPSTTMSSAEIVTALDNLALGKLEKIRELRDGDNVVPGDVEALARQAQLVKAAGRQAAKAAKKAAKAAGSGAMTYEAKQEAKRAAAAQAAKSIATKVLEDVRESPDVLEDPRYCPREISIFAADFTGKLLPKLTFELRQTKKQLQKKLKEIRDRKMSPAQQEQAKQFAAEIDNIESQLSEPVKYLQQSGWRHLGDMVLSSGGEVATVKFEAVTATHILVQIKSNHGADRVKIGEVRVLTSDPMPPESSAIAADVWPNVAGIGYKPSIGWQFVAYIILTAAEIMVSITCLEFSYTQAPKKMKSFIQAVFLLSISLGNAFTAVVNWFIENEDGTSKLAGPRYYWFFVVAMLVTAVLFIPVARRYRVKSYIQDEAPSESSA